MRYLIRELFRQISLLAKIIWIWKYKFQNDLVNINNIKFRIIDGLSFYIQYKDIFIRRIYEFETSNPKPLIIDGGSNIGVSILYFNFTYPAATIIGFEPDPGVFKILSENVRQMENQRITLINAGLAGIEGSAFFTQDGNVGGSISHLQETNIQVKIAKLSNYIQQEVDYLKLNIEGLELEVLDELDKAEKLSKIKLLVIEYHGWKDKSQCLAKILEILERNQFYYMVHDFDYETCSSSKPPIRFSLNNNWFCLVYAKNMNLEMIDNKKFP